jgi:predicted dehydrogenase
MLQLFARPTTLMYHFPRSWHKLEYTFYDKPLSTTIESAKELLGVVRKHDIELLIGHHRRFNPYVIKAKQIVESGSLGQIIAVRDLWTAIKPPQCLEPEAVKW